MKYLLSENINIEDLARFITNHDGEFVDEMNGITQIDSIDIIACYQEDAEKYRKYGKKIITVTPLNVLFSCPPLRNF